MGGGGGGYFADGNRQLRTHILLKKHARTRTHGRTETQHRIVVMQNCINALDSNVLGAIIHEMVIRIFFSSGETESTITCRPLSLAERLPQLHYKASQSSAALTASSS